MKLRSYLFLSSLSLITCILVGFIERVPGYMDADYYYAGGIQLANGSGFNELYIWNYLDDPDGLPHPSHGYWMPMASIVAAFGMIIAGNTSLWSARIGFYILAALLPVVAASLSWRLMQNERIAWVSGLLAVFCGYYLVYLPTIDAFSLYMLFGSLYFLLFLQKGSTITSLLLGIIAGLMHLTRSDGLMWLPLGILTAVFQNYQKKKNLTLIWVAILLPFVGYLLVMTPWLLRNYQVFGTPLAPGASKLLWLTSYDQLFSFPANGINFDAWVQSGFTEIVKVRLWALGFNLLNAFAVQGGMFIFPLSCFGAWHLRRHPITWLALGAWIIMLLVMTVIFPFAGARGGFLHSGAALQVVWWVFASIGLDRVIAWGISRRGWKPFFSNRLFPITLISLAGVFTILVTLSKVGGMDGSGWQSDYREYELVDDILANNNIPSDEIVIVSNPPGFWLATGHPAIVIPFGNVDAFFALAERYTATIVVFEEDSLPDGLMAIYENPDDYSSLLCLGQTGDLYVYEIKH